MRRLTTFFVSGVVLTALVFFMIGCPSTDKTAVTGSGQGNEAFVPPGKHDDFYAFMSGGFSGQIGVYGLPSGRLLRVIPVFSQDAEKGYGYSEETKPLLNTSHGLIQWDDLHHLQLSSQQMVNKTGVGFLRMPIIHHALRGLTYVHSEPRK
jgi:nitrous-oxide reductase